jgi:hypothetical protein
MQKQIDAVELLSAVAMRSQKAKSYPPATYVIDIGELRQIISQMQGKEREAQSA